MQNFLKSAAFALSLAIAAAPAAMAQPVAKPAYSTAESTIGALLDNPAAKEVLSKHLPAFVSNPQIEMARSRTLRSIQEFMPDQLTDDVLNKVDADLAKLPPK